MSKLYAIKLNNGNLHKNNMGEIVYFTNKKDVQIYMKYNHYNGEIVKFDIGVDKDKQISDLEAKLAESENKHLLDETEWQDYCAFKHIEPQIKGCLDREREYEKQLEEKDKAIENWQTMYQSVVQTCYNDKEEIERLNKRLETQENTITNLVEDNRASQE